MVAANNRIFVDANFFVALFNPQDTLYKEAIAKSQTIQKEKPLLVISNYIFLEIVTVLSQRVNRKAAITLGKHLLEDKQVQIVHIDKHLNNSAWEIFKEIEKKNVGFVDCSSLAVIEFEEIGKFLTFDQKDFAGLVKKYQFSFY